ncbi:MAG TPA: ribonuclease R [Bauldia sp.]|nr:ribonuclease R [Bauldia sp.]
MNETKQPKQKKTKPQGQQLPTREQLLAFIAEHPGETGKREIARHFGITGAQRIPLKALLKDLAREGAVESRYRKLKRTDDLPEVTVVEITGRDRDGELIGRPVEWPAEAGDAPRIDIAPTRAKDAPAPGIGDRVLARISKPEREYTGRIIKVLEKRPATLLGVVRGATIDPIDKKQKALTLDQADVGKAKDGDLVSLSINVHGRFGLERARIVEVLGSVKNEKAVSMIAIHAHSIPHVFPPDVLKEAEAAKAATLEHREDWRHEPLVTIDPPDAKDHDDAVMAVPDADPNNPGGTIVTVAIADVAWYVRPGSPLDREALKRGNSVYFPDRVVPMLPERISNDLCSLREAEDRPALAVRMVFNAQGRKLNHRFHRIMMRSAAKLSYQKAQDTFDGRATDLTQSVKTALANLWAGYEILKRGRDAREPLDLDLPERKVIVGKDGGIERIVVPVRLEAMRLIEEMMIQANVAAAETLEAKKSPLVYRIHDQPSLAKQEALRDFLKSIELSFPKGGNLRPSNFNFILSKAEGSEHGPLLHEVVLRTQAQAEYSPENIGHFGLNLRRYAHFTSPIRRYADLIVHRALVRSLSFGPGGLPDGIEEHLAEIAAQISAAERRAMAAERDTIDRLVAHWLADRIGAEFPGRISGVTRAGLFVKLDETGADGFVPMRTLGSEFFVYDEAKHAVIGSRSGEMHRLGDQVTVRLVEAAPLAGALRFELTSEGRVLPRKDRPSPDQHRRPGNRGRAPDRGKKRGRR